VLRPPPPQPTRIMQSNKSGRTFIVSGVYPNTGNESRGSLVTPRFPQTLPPVRFPVLPLPSARCLWRYAYQNRRTARRGG
jgi:hypothetical protein